LPPFPLKFDTTGEKEINQLGEIVSVKIEEKEVDFWAIRLDESSDKAGLLYHQG